MEPAQISHNGLPRRLQQPELVTTVRGVWQDNPAPPRERTASPQPASVQKDTRSRQKETKTTRSQNRPTSKQKLVPLQVWAHPLVKAEIQRIAEREGLSTSKVGSAFLEKAIQQNLHSQHTTLLDTVIEKAIGKHMRAYSNRLAVLLVRSLFNAEQTRSFAVNILGRQPGMTDEKLNDIKKGANNTARANITRITPQLQTLLETIEKWLEEGVNASG